MKKYDANSKSIKIITIYLIVLLLVITSEMLYENKKIEKINSISKSYSKLEESEPQGENTEKQYTRIAVPGTPGPLTIFTVRYYVHDIGANTYTLYETEELSKAVNATVATADLAKEIAGFTYEGAYTEGDTTKPTDGAVDSINVSRSANNAVNLYYRRNYLCIEYDANGGKISSGSYKLKDTLVSTSKGATKFLRGVYGSTVNQINTTEYKITKNGLHNVATFKLKKPGYTIKAATAYNTKPDGTGKSFSQSITSYKANTFAGVDLSKEDQVVRLYVNWIPSTYTITYELNGGVNSSENPSKYTIESKTLKLENPTKEGYVFAGWTTQTVNEPTIGLLIPKGSYGNITATANWEDITTLIIQEKNNSYFLGNDKIGDGQVTKNKIEKITIAEDITDANRNAWDVSTKQDKSILAWYDDSDNNGLYEVTIGSVYGKVFANEDSSNLFSFIGMNNKAEIKGLNNLDISNVEKMDRMFYGCKNIEKIDISGWNTSKVKTVSEMFSECSKLKRLYVGDKWSTESISESQDMFSGCQSLRGINGIAFDPAHIDATYAKYEGGYLTHINSKEEPNLGTNGIVRKEAEITAKNKKVSIDYWLYVPDIEDIGTYKDIPLVVYLHGDKDNLQSYTIEDVGNYSLPGFLKDGIIKPNAIIIAPCRTVYFADWGKYYIPELVKQVKQEYETIDSNRIAVTGHSTGANSAIVAAAENPGLFSACVPVSYRYGNLLAAYGPKIDCAVKLVFESQGSSTWITKAKSYVNSYKEKQDVSYEVINDTSHGNVVNYYKEGLTDWMIAQTRVEEIPETYQIVYELNGGSNSINNPTQYTTKSETITLEDASKDGYTFVGWTTETIKEPTKGLQIPTGFKGDITFFANWEENKVEEDKTQETPTTQTPVVTTPETNMGTNGIELRTEEIMVNNKKTKVSYWIYVPNIEDIKTYKEIPLIIYLHGGSSSGNKADSYDVTGYSLPYFLKNGRLKPNAIVISLVNYSANVTDSANIVKGLIAHAKSIYDIDLNNISITGHSTGAHIAFEIAMKNQGLFATCVPVSLRYQGSYSQIKNIKNCDFRFVFESKFAGAAKSETEMKNIKKEVDKLNKNGTSCIVQYETIPDSTHNGAVKCYNAELMDWMTGNRRK